MTSNVTEKLAPPIFVVGYMHSGTTLLQRILTRSPAIYAGIGESRFFDSLPIFQAKFPNLADDDILCRYVVYLTKIIQTGFAKVYFSSRGEAQLSVNDLDISAEQFAALFAASQLQREHARIFALVFNTLTRYAGRERWLEKTPMHLFYVPQILRVAPDACFIELVRDPRDILASKQSRAQGRVGHDPLWDTLAWKSAVHAADAHQLAHPDQILRVRYEDLVSEPSDVVQQICVFLDLDFTPEMLQIGWVNSTTVSTQRAGSGGISMAAIGNWQRKLAPETAVVSQWVARAELQQLGYQIQFFPWPTHLKAPLVLLRSGLEFFSRIYSRWRVGGFTYLRNVLNNYRLRLVSLARR